MHDRLGRCYAAHTQRVSGYAMHTPEIDLVM